MGNLLHTEHRWLHYTHGPLVPVKSSRQTRQPFRKRHMYLSRSGSSDGCIHVTSTVLKQICNHQVGNLAQLCLVDESAYKSDSIFKLCCRSPFADIRVEQTFPVWWIL